MDGLETIHIFTDTCGTESSESIYKNEDELISINILTVLHKNIYLNALNGYFLFNLH